MSKLLTEEELRKQLAELGYFLKKDIKYILTPEQLEQYEMREIEVNLRLANLVESQKKAYAEYVIGKDVPEDSTEKNGQIFDYRKMSLLEKALTINFIKREQRERAGL